jgi:hypothetical protein
MKVNKESYKLINEAVNYEVSIKISKIVNIFIYSIESIKDSGSYLKSINMAPTIKAFNYNKDGTLNREDFEQFIYDLIYVNYGEDMFKQEMNKLSQCAKNITSEKKD